MFLPLGLGLKLPKFPIITAIITAVILYVHFSVGTFDSQITKIYEKHDSQEILPNLLQGFCKLKGGKADDCDFIVKDLKKEIEKKKTKPKLKIKFDEKLKTEKTKKKSKVFKYSRAQRKILNQFQKALKKKEPLLDDIPIYAEYLKRTLDRKRALKEFYRQNNLLSKMNLNFISVFKAEFLHGGLAHLFGNLFFFIVFGAYVECRLGAIDYCMVYFLGGLLGLAGGVFFMEETRYLVGASANISAVMGAFYILFQKHYLKFVIVHVVVKTVLIPVKVIFPLMYIASEIASMITGGTNVAHHAHLIGLAAGAAIAYYFSSQQKVKWPNIYVFEQEHIKTLIKNKKHPQLEKICLDIITWNPCNYLARDLLLTRTIEEIYQHKKITLKQKNILLEHVERYVGRALFYKDKKTAFKFLNFIPLHLKYIELLNGLSQKDLLVLGDYSISGKQFCTGLRIYETFIHLYPKSKNSSNLKKTVESIVFGIPDGNEYEKIKKLASLNPFSFISKMVKKRELENEYRAIKQVA